MATGYVWDSLFAWHDTGTFAGSQSAAPLAGVQPGLPYEHPDTKRRFHELVEVSGLLKHLRRLEPRPVSHEQMAAVHDRGYLNWLKGASTVGGVELQGSTHVGKDSFEIARLSAGATLSAVNAVLDGEVSNAYALSRPPGHHAVHATGMGFCLLNNIGIAVTDAYRRGAVQRVAVVDWDVHHGNGTQSIFYSDPSVLTISLHQDRLYPPDSGQLSENGERAGAGANINIPLPPGSGHGAYLEAFHA